jgi:hypothetical protein
MNARYSGMPAHPGSPLAVAGWLITALLCIFTAENLWLDPWLKGKGHLPSLVPAAMGGTWFVVCAMMAIALVLLVLSQILMWRESAAPAWKRTMRSFGALLALLLCAAWFVTTSGMEINQRLNLLGKHHTVTLSWQRSITDGVKYNVYRSTTRGKNYVKLNSDPLTGRSYKDKDVQSGVTYYYVTRSIDADGRESVDSNEAQATVPQ